MNIGLDIGNRYTKLSFDEKNISFPSIVAKGKRKGRFGSPGIHEVFYNGTYYLIGSETQGAPLKGNEKYSSEDYTILAMTAIALAASTKRFDAINVNVIIGTPADCYNTMADLYEEPISKIVNEDITINDVVVNITVDNVLAIPQSAVNLSPTKEVEYPCMFVDFGGGTLDVSYWNEYIDEDGASVPYIVLCKSYTEYGFDAVLKELATTLSMNTDIQCKEKWFDMEKTIHKDTIKTATGIHNIKNMKDDLLNKYASDVYSSLTDDGFNIGSLDKVYLLGGCASLVGNYFKDLCNKTETELEPQPQFTNSKLFLEIAKRQFNRKDKGVVNG